jgi:hypothetical protein
MTAGSEREIGNLDTGAEPPEPVQRLAAERGLGRLVDVRRELSTTGALVKGGAGIVGGLVLMLLMGWLAGDAARGNTLVSAIARPFAIAGLFALVWGIVMVVRGLAVGSRAHYLFAGGLVAKRRSGPIAVAWPQVEQFEARYNRKTRDIVGYRVHAPGGATFMVPLVLTDNRDAFIDRIVDQLRAHGRPVN